ncbi:type IV fimbrial biogenesis protein FimT [Variovorax sp. CF079]|uniref:GspH/FimT family pseudopilin n=1 Tax=Variovorax sp. CF079 TaxID=1882774 RepID=UPI00088140A3|nr:GspH/FimT family pseudopilin [Variovorax sp. CF079]SDC90230.1 type IV fimbrial biogenesis protein FimT [Variovorax sp. CF079]
MLVSRRRTRRHVRGFTLIELVTVITVMGVLAALALPSFRAFVANQRIRNVSFDLMAALTLARSEAVTRNRSVDLTKTGGAWDEGWTVKEGTNVFHSQQAFKNLAISDSSDLDVITYGKDGRTVTTSTKFTIAPSPAMAGVNSRCISIGLSGLPSSSMGAC